MNIGPHSDIRGSAAILFQFFVAYVQAGFTAEQAMELVKTMVQTQMITGTSDEDDDS